MTSTSLTIIVCTYNRAKSLQETLECLAQQEISESTRWELVVVNNNSTDETIEVVAAMQKKIPALRYEFESKQGLSHARNRGISVARGDVILFTDDDVCPDVKWAATLLKHMVTTECSACGGFVAPRWEAPPPSWLTERLYGYLAVHAPDRNFERVVHDVQDAPYGANIAFPRKVFDKVGLFDPSLGRKGNVLAGGEEWDLVTRILKEGMKVMFFPDARVYHRIEAERMTRGYFRRWRYEASRTIADNDGAPGERRLFGIPLYFFCQFFRAASQAFSARFRLPADVAFQKEILCWHFLGTMAGLYKSRRR